MLKSFFPALLLLLVFSPTLSAHADCSGWCPPTAGPTSAAGASVPLNTSASGQTKTGTLTLGALGDLDVTHGNLNLFGVGSFNNGLGVFGGNFLIATGSPAFGKVLMATNSGGIATWAATSTLGLGGGLWTISGNNIYNSNSGNVGVGTNNPVNKLQIGGVANGWNGYSFLVGNGTWQIGLIPISGGGALDSNGTIVFRAPPTAGGALTELMRITAANGNVGIGTTAPAGKLQVGDGSGTADVRVADGSGTIGVGSSSGIFRMQTDGASIRFLSPSNGYAPIKAQTLQLSLLESGGICNAASAGMIFLRNIGSNTSYDLCACVLVYVAGAGTSVYDWKPLNNNSSNGTCS